MKTLPAVAGSLVGLLAVLSLPGPEPPVAPAPARGHGFAWNQDAFWRSLEKTYGDARAVGCRAADPVAARELSALGSTADRLLGAPLDPGAAVLDSVERRFFTLAPLVAACPRHLGDYVRLSGRLREAIKWQSRRWDVEGDAARARLYRSLYGLRGAVEEVMLHHPDSVTALLDGRHEPSATPATTVQGVEIHSGDILVSRGGYPTSALIARGNDYPGNFSHIGLVHVDQASHAASVIEAHIERAWRSRAPSNTCATKSSGSWCCACGTTCRSSPETRCCRTGPLRGHSSALARVTSRTISRWTTTIRRSSSVRRWLPGSTTSWGSTCGWASPRSPSPA